MTCAEADQRLRPSVLRQVLGLLESRPIQPELTNRGPKCAQSQVAPAVIRQYGRAVGGRVGPLPMRTASAPRDLLAAQRGQFPGCLAVNHMDSTRASDQTT